MKNNKEKAKKSSFSLSALIRNNRFLMVASLVIAFGLWMWVAIEKSPEVTNVITGIPVQINLENSIPEQLGLQIFGESEFTVDVTVKGKKYIVSSLDANDIDVVANTNYVDSSGTKTLQLKITPKNSSDDFTIASSSSTYIEVYFDTYKETEMALTANLQSSLDSLIPEGCLLGDVVFSKNTVLISGPATEINRISSVSAEVKVDKILEKTTTFDPEIKIITNDGSTLEYSKINAVDDITMTVPVLKVVTLPTAIEFKNAPSGFINNPMKYTISPASVSVAIPVDAVETTKAFVVDTIDFADIGDSYNTFTVDADSINTYKIMDSNVKRFKITINASTMSSKTLTVPVSNISIKNSREDFKVILNTTKDITVTLVGPQEDINAITAEDLAIEIDTTDKLISSDTKTLQGNVIVSSEYNCWAFGKYEIKITAEAIE